MASRSAGPQHRSASDRSLGVPGHCARRAATALVALAVGLALASCGGDDDDKPAAGAAKAAPKSDPQAAALVKAASGPTQRTLRRTSTAPSSSR